MTYKTLTPHQTVLINAHAYDIAEAAVKIDTRSGGDRASIEQDMVDSVTAIAAMLGYRVVDAEEAEAGDAA